MPPYPLKNFEIQKYYQNNLNLMVVTQDDNNDNLLKMKDGTCIINLDAYELKKNILDSFVCE